MDKGRLCKRVQRHSILFQLWTRESECFGTCFRQEAKFMNRNCESKTI